MLPSSGSPTKFPAISQHRPGIPYNPSTVLYPQWKISLLWFPIEKKKRQVNILDQGKGYFQPREWYTEKGRIRSFPPALNHGTSDHRMRMSCAEWALEWEKVVLSHWQGSCKLISPSLQCSGNPHGAVTHSNTNLKTRQTTYTWLPPNSGCPPVVTFMWVSCILLKHQCLPLNVF